MRVIISIGKKMVEVRLNMRMVIFMKGSGTMDKYMGSDAIPNIKMTVYIKVFGEKDNIVANTIINSRLLLIFFDLNTTIFIFIRYIDIQLFSSSYSSDSSD
jgi:hypothetical protein